MSAGNAGNTSSAGVTDSAETEDGMITEPIKVRGVVGERVWGPYRTHKGIPMSEKYSGGPRGLGDPEDRTMRVVERTILIPNQMKKKANATTCKEANEKFFSCAAENGMFTMAWKCRVAARGLRDCVSGVLNDPVQIEAATDEYLEGRAEYRRTGKRKLLKRM